MCFMRRYRAKFFRYFILHSSPLFGGHNTEVAIGFAAGKRVVEAYDSKAEDVKKNVLLDVANSCGPELLALENAIHNPSLVHEVREAATPVHFRLLQSIGNLPGGVKVVCDMRAHLLYLMKTESDKSIVAALHRLERSAHELLVLWFCQSNMKLERLTWQSPGDILQKVADYEAVHPVQGMMDFKKRVGSYRRCFYFSHEAMPREPLVIVHVALLNEIANNVQSIVECDHLDCAEDECSTAIYYSITSAEPGSVIDDDVLAKISQFSGKQATSEEATRFLLELLSNVERSKLEPLKDVLLHCCAHYLTSRRQNGFALNPVANFHLRNGAELYRLNWMGDTSARGLQNSLGIMVNYRYRLEKVLENSVHYTLDKRLAVHENVRSLL
ncbi:Malonyl-CoA decarboxylase [Ancylostoma caninum]|uniref:Malonyl-CoA decarboxylase n=1 Tax=Ancylostoma caninum TaxID=29170 RepID=A0A368GB01_ANCCA|nr:Malonyl-CoA decarboxylase [Ancylostoma caninum]